LRGHTVDDVQQAAFRPVQFSGWLDCGDAHLLNIANG